MSKVQLLVNGAPLHLPRVAPAGRKFLRPGSHAIPSKDWEAVKAHPAVRAWLKQGRLVESPGASAGPPEPPDRLTALRDMTIDDALPHIHGSSDPKQLTGWRYADRRKGIHEAIDDRLSELDEEE